VGPSADLGTAAADQHGPDCAAHGRRTDLEPPASRAVEVGRPASARHRHRRGPTTGIPGTGTVADAAATAAVPDRAGAIRAPAAAMARPV